MSANGTKKIMKQKIRVFCCEGHLASGCAVMSKYFLEITIRGAELGYYVTVRNKNRHNNTNKKAAVKSSDHIPITYLWSTSLASCILKNGFRCFVPHIICNNNQFSTPERENAHRRSLRAHSSIEIFC